MNAKDSLINLRAIQHNKRSFPEPSCPRRSIPLPMDLLRAQVVAKRPRTTNNVRFDATRNSTHDLHVCPDDLKQTWMSWEESDRVRLDNMRVIRDFKRGQLDAKVDCLRGLELHTSPELVRKKIDNGRQYVAVVLEQQDFLRNMMGRANETILARLSSVLSQEDRNDAIDNAAMDSQEAGLIYSLDAPMKSTKLDNDMTSALPQASLMKLLATR